MFLTAAPSSSSLLSTACGWSVTVVFSIGATRWCAHLDKLCLVQVSDVQSDARRNPGNFSVSFSKSLITDLDMRRVRYGTAAVDSVEYTDAKVEVYE